MSEGQITAAQLRRIQKALTTVPFARLLGIELENIASGTATLAVTVRKELTQNQGVVHGGAIASLIDTATALAIISLLPPKEKVTTVDLAISYLRPAIGGSAKSRRQRRSPGAAAFRRFGPADCHTCKANDES